jgi:prepilin-type processing-associated H-X9-DG protein
LNNVDGDTQINPGGHRLATSNYVGCNTARNWVHADTAAHANNKSTNSNRIRNVDAGVFVEQHGMAFRDIIDGTSNVIAVGERRYRFNSKPGGPVTTAGYIRLAGAGVVFGVQDRINAAGRRRVMARGVYIINYEYEHGNARADQGFSSQHPGGAQFVFCDGSVNFIPETVEADVQSGANVGVLANHPTLGNATPNTVWEKLCARGDGQPVGDF